MNEDVARLSRQKIWAALALSLMLLGGCDAAQPDAPKQGERQSHALTIYGYNYTNRYIDQFYVDGQGGGNLDVSTPTSGGGGRVCCISWRDGTPLPQKVKVRWMNAACKRWVTNSSGESRQVPVPQFVETEAALQGPVPANPRYFEVHIYPDEHIEVAITAMPSEPRLKLSEAREVRGYPECKEGVK
ncbi:MAG: DUF3304 domain-containing protein [Rhizobacter sp.]|nr:DUF3304 domain-containing protein [Rhizobacter sp.]